MAEPHQFIRVTDVNRIRWLEFNRGPVNAFNRQMVEEMREALAAATTSPAIRVIVLASAIEKYFSAGADLNEFRGMKSDGMSAWVSMCHDIANLLRGSEKPILAAIHGTAVGGGLEMTLHSDVRFAASGAKFGQPEIQIAFIPPIATTQALVRLIGRPRTLRYLYEGALVPVEVALTWGLIDEIVEPDALHDHVQSYAENLAAKSATALAAIRKTVTTGGGLTFDDGMQLEHRISAALADTPDFAEGIGAFLEKRSPQWEGNES